MPPEELAAKYLALTDAYAALADKHLALAEKLNATTDRYVTKAREAGSERVRGDTQYRKWQEAMRRVRLMRAELVRLGVTDPAVLGGEVFTLTLKDEAAGTVIHSHLPGTVRHTPQASVEWVEKYDPTTLTDVRKLLRLDDLDDDPPADAPVLR
jgi:hypothetical protein